MGLDPRFIIHVVCSSKDTGRWAKELHKLGKWKKYTFGIVMVGQGFKTHHVNLNTTSTITDHRHSPSTSPRRNVTSWSSCYKRG